MLFMFLNEKSQEFYFDLKPLGETLLRVYSVMNAKVRVLKFE